MKKLKDEHYKALWLDAEERLVLLQSESDIEIKALQQKLYLIQSHPSTLRKNFELAAQQRDEISMLLRASELDNVRLKKEIEALNLELKRL
jgi:hypothetical protein